MSTRRTLAALTFCAALAPDFAAAEGRVGVVTAVTGPVLVARASDGTAEPVHFRDAIRLRDRVTTGEQAMTRILLGGRVVVTAREHSTLTLIDVPGTSTIDVATGRVAVTVDRSKLAAGSLVEVRTPHAVTAVAGDTLVVEVRADVSIFTVLGGHVDIFRLDSRTGAPVDPPTTVVAPHAVSVGDKAVSRPRPLTAAQARQLAEEFAPPVRPVAALELPIVRDELARALAALTAASPGTTSAALLVPPVAAPAVASAPQAPTARAELRPGRPFGGPFSFVFGGPGGVGPGRGRDRERDHDGAFGPRR